MSEEPVAPKPTRRWVFPASIVAGILAIVALSNLPALEADRLPTIDTMQGYRDEMMRANDLAKPIFAKIANGDELTEHEQGELLEVAKIVDNGNSFLPNRVIPYLAAGKAYQYASKLDLAEARYLKCIDNTKFEHDPASLATATEAHYRLSQMYLTAGFDEDALKQAKIAIQQQPNSPDYLAAAASAEIQCKDLGAAGIYVMRGLKLDPRNKTILGLELLLSTSPDYLTTVAEALLKKHDLDRARVQVDQALKIDPKHAKALELDAELARLGRPRSK